MNEKQQQLTYEKGITTAPSDATCSDNALEDCVGLVYRDGEHRPLQTPVSFATGTPKVLFVHRHASEERYITIQNDVISWGTITSGQYSNGGSLLNVSGSPLVSAIGKVLIINDNNGLRYFLWKGSTYAEYSYDMPEILMDMWLVNDKQLDPHENIIRTITGDQLVDTDTKDIQGYSVTVFSESSDADKYDSWQSKVIGAISERINTLHKFGAFCFPFWIRYGLVLYDGSVTHLSAPILAMPTVLHGAFLSHTNSNGDEEVPTYEPGMTGVSKKFVPTVGFGFLRMQLSQDVVTTLNNWKDIISGIRIYVSEEVKNFELEGTWTFCNNGELDSNETPRILLDSVCRKTWSTSLADVDASSWNKKTMKKMEGDWHDVTTYILPTLKTEDRIRNELISNSTFYQLFEIDVTDLTTNVINAEDVFSSNALSSIKELTTLTTQTQLEADDYFSHTKTKADFIFPYNGRLNISGITRTPFEGFHQFILCESLSEYSFKIVVYIDADGDELKVVHTASNVIDMMGKYFFYPDPRAKKAEIYIKEGNEYKLLYTLTLKEHPGLNGAYYFGTMPNDSDKNLISGLGYYDTCYPASQNSTIPTIVTTPEKLDGIIQTSEVNNPFLFLAKGTFNIGLGRVFAMSTITHALSQGQFGQYPLILFSNSGIWAASLNAEGYFTSVTPLSRETALESNPCVTQTDNAVLFASVKGLMRIGDGGVVCLSEQLRDIAPFLKTAFMVYDHKHSLIWIIGASSQNGQTCYIYNLKTGTFTKHNRTQQQFISSVNLYPDNLICVNNGLLSFDMIPNEDSDNTTYNATIKTRPMKLENALALKSILGMQHIKSLSAGASMTLKIEASNNLDNWVELKSLRGMPWKYYKFTYTFTNLKAIDSFAGTLLITQERRNQKLR